MGRRFEGERNKKLQWIDIRVVIGAHRRHLLCCSFGIISSMTVTAPESKISGDMCSTCLACLLFSLAFESKLYKFKKMRMHNLANAQHFTLRD